MDIETQLRIKIQEIGERHQRAYLEETEPLRKALEAIIARKSTILFLPLDVDIDLKIE